MRQDLAALLDDVWNRSLNGRNALSFNEIYAQYEAPSGTHDFLESLHPHHVQTGKLPDDPEKLLEVYTGYERENTGAGYLWFASPYFQYDAATQRVVIHANPYKSVILLMKLIINEMLKEPPNPIYGNVNSAKAATLPCFAFGRNDTIIIYTCDENATHVVISRLQKWIKEGAVKQGQLIGSLPYLIETAHPGIGWSSEPPENVTVLDSYPAKLSFGKYLSQVLQIGLQIFVDNNATSKSVYDRLMQKVLTLAGFNLDHPHKISTPDAVFLQSVPWPGGQERKQKALYQRMAKDMGLVPFRSHN